MWQYGANDRWSKSSMSRRTLIEEESSPLLRKQWRHGARGDARVLAHWYDRSTDRDFFVTGWDGANVCMGLVEGYVRTFRLSEADGCTVDQDWDDTVTLEAVRRVVKPLSESFDEDESPMTRMMRGVNKALHEQAGEDVRSRIVGSLSQFSRKEEAEEDQKWIVAKSRATVADESPKFIAEQSYRDIPVSFMPIRVVRAGSPEEAIRQFLVEERTGYRPEKRNTLDVNRMNEIIRQVLDEGR